MLNYKKMKIEDIEKTVDVSVKQSRQSLTTVYETLEYLRTSKRFRENQMYKKATFWEYIEDRFTIREKTFRENVDAFLKYPEESLEFGVGLVSRVKRQCGKKNAKRVFQKIKVEQEKRKRPLRRDQIDNIINAESPKIKRSITAWREMYKAEKIAHEQTRAALKEAMNEIDRKDTQIEKLKEAVYSFETA